jgi:hypothetical protein
MPVGRHDDHFAMNMTRDFLDAEVMLTFGILLALLDSFSNLSHIAMSGISGIAIYGALRHLPPPTPDNTSFRNRRTLLKEIMDHAFTVCS